MNNIEILREIQKQKPFIVWVNDKPYNKSKAIENLIQENKELKEYQYKVNEIMNFDEENLDVTRVSNNYIGLKNCVTQFRKQVEKLEQENKELKEKLEEKDMQHELELIEKEDCISKSKVKEKIEELEKERKRKDEEDTINPFYDQIDITHIIEVLQELLKEE